MNDIFRNKKVFIFDLDGTLIDSLRIFEDIDKIILEKLCGIKLKNMYSIRKRFKGNDKDEVNFSLYAEYLKKSLNLAFNTDDFCKLRIEEYYKYLKEKVVLKKHAIKFINEIKNKGYLLILATNNNTKVIDIYRYENTNLIKAGGLIEKFDFIITSESLNPKPAPDIFMQALKMTNFSARECIVFEDSLPGVIAASKSNIDVIHIKEKKSRKYLKEIKEYTSYLNMEYKDLISML